MIAVTVTLLALHAAPLDLPTLAASTRPAVVKLVLEDGRGQEVASGSGFFVSPTGRILTNHHVISGGEQVTAVLDDGRKLRIIGILADDEPEDLAILQVAPGTYPSLQLAGSDAVRVGDPVAVIGSPVGLQATLSDGIVSALRKEGLHEKTDGEGERYRSWELQITAPISPGSSGSPVLSSEGKVVGVAVGERIDGQALNFAVPAERAARLLAGIGPDTAPRPLRPTHLLRNLGISGAAFLLVGVVLLLFPRSSSRERSAR